MSTKRTPRSRSGVMRVTPRAIKLFDAMQRCNCTCPERDWGGKYWEHEQCAGCVKYYALRDKLHDELKLSPWDWPTVQSPTAENPYPPFHAQFPLWKPDHKAVKRWKILYQASREAKQKLIAPAKAKRKAARPAPPLEQPPFP
jgi:hypothetical protein